MPHSDVDWVAILVSAIAGFMIGGLWYRVFFGRKWSAVSGLREDQLGTGAALAYGLGFVCTFIMAYAMARLIDYVWDMPGEQTTGHGILLGFLIWVGFVATTGLTNDLFGRRPLMRWVIESLHHLVVLVVMGAILAAWPESD
jgi:hypothetical protein